MGPLVGQEALAVSFTMTLVRYSTAGTALLLDYTVFTLLGSCTAVVF